MPLSLTRSVSLTRPAFAGAPRTSSRTAPCAVNFTALSSRFSSAARSRTGSPTSRSGSPSAIVTSVRSDLVCARASSDAAKASSIRRGRKTSCCRISAPAWALAASTISAVSADRCSAPVLMAAAQSRSRVPIFELASNSPSARIPVSAVRMSCANAASARSPALTAGARRRAGRRATRAADFLLAFFPALFFCFDLFGATAIPSRERRRA